MTPVGDPTQNQGPHASGFMVGERPPPQNGRVGPDGARWGGWTDRGCRLALPTYGDLAKAKSDQGRDWEIVREPRRFIQPKKYKRFYGVIASIYCLDIGKSIAAGSQPELSGGGRKTMGLKNKFI